MDGIHCKIDNTVDSPGNYYVTSIVFEKERYEGCFNNLNKALDHAIKVLNYITNELRKALDRKDNFSSSCNE